MQSANIVRLDRRQLLKAGSALPLGLMLPELLRAEGADSRREEKSCIVIYQYGGLSQLDSWDPKPQAPVEVRGPYEPIATSVPGFQIGELMPRLAKLANKYAVIRSMSHTVPNHDVANRMLLAGQRQAAGDWPAFGSIVAKVRPSTANVPSYVWLQKFGGGASPPEETYVSGGFLGAAQAPLILGTSHDDNPGTPGYQLRVFEPAEEVPVDRMTKRRDLLASLEGASAHDNSAKPLQSFSRFHERAFDLLTGPAARKAFDLQREDEAIRDRYGRNPLGQNLLLARRLVEAGVRLVSVVGWAGLAAGDKFLSVETWDMHGNAGIGIFDHGWNGLPYALPRCDQAVATLLEDLEQRGLLASTLVVLVGEFGRTPKISRGAAAIGRDHWPQCYSAMLAGAGIRGGAVLGESDSQAAYVKERPVSPEDFAATLYQALGIPANTRLSPDGFTRPVSLGTPVRELFG